jgi:uncharacterized sulfatase
MPERPNIVLAITDSQGWNLMGDCGDGFVDTPHLDDLAAEGVSFENAYTTAPVCTPARAGLFTGRFAHDAGGWTNLVELYDSVSTMGEYFSDAGYRTAYVGKWHLDGDYMGEGEAPPGYADEYWYDGQNYRDQVGEEFWEWFRSGMSTRVAENDIDEIHERGVDRTDTWAGGITDRAIEFVQEDDDRPFFLVVSYDEPHEPSLCPPPYCDRYRDTRYPLPDNFEDRLEEKPLRHREFAQAYASGNAFMNSIEDAEERGGIYRPLYFGCAEFVDDEIGRVFDAACTADRNTIRAFTSDHGHYLGAHGLDLKGAPMYDEVTNVPLIVSGPEFATGDRSDALVSHSDILPTFLEVAGIEQPATLHGRSLVPAARDPAADHREAIMVSYQSYARQRADGDGFYPVRCLVSVDGYKLVLNLLETDELYDLEEEPRECQNRINDPALAERRDNLHRTLLERMGATNDAFSTADWADRPWRDDVERTVHPG